MPTAEILSQGDEVITGQVIDSNAAWIAERLTELGFDVVRHTAVGDRLDDIVAALHAAAGRAALVVSTGGLGPTEDDLTAAAVAAAFGRPLARDPEAMAWIEAMYARYGRKMPEVNRKQADLPTGCVRLDNAWGTAPGFAVEHANALLCFLPGVPREMKPMLEERVLPLVRARFTLAPARLVTLRTTGAGESDLQERLAGFDPGPATLSFRTMLPENHIKLRVPADVDDAGLRALVADAAARLGAAVFAIEGLGAPGGSLPEVVGRALVSAGATLAVAESCTGGRVASMCTAIPGSSAWFLEGAVTYSNAAKERMLGVLPATLAAHGAVSEPVALEMAIGMRDRSGATWGLSTTGIAGPDGGSEEKPVGTVHIAVAGPGVVLHRRLRLGGDRHRIQTLAAASVLDLLRRHLHSLA